jgi:DNA mismatch endonuclease (patch repair protein)
MVLPRLRKVIFIHGCFWHGHNCKAGRKKAKTNAKYWADKIARNRARDKAAVKALKREGWEVMIVWECRLKKPGELRDKLIRFLPEDKKSRGRS